MAKKKEMTLQVEKELDLGNSGITIQIYGTAGKLGRLEINKGRFRFYEKNKGNENLVLNIDEMIAMFQEHSKYKKKPAKA